MKILVISQYFYPENFRINDFVDTLVERGNDVTVISAIPNYPSGKIIGSYKIFKDKYKSIDIYRFPIFLRRNNKLSLALNYISFFLSSIFFYPIFFRFKKFDHIFCPLYSPPTNGFIGLYASFFSNAKVSLWVQDLWPESFTMITKSSSKIIPNSINFFMKYLYKKSDYIFVQSKMFIKHIEQYSDVNKSNIFYLPNWAENIFMDLKNSDLDRFQNKKKSILFAGNIGEAQNLEFLLTLIKEMKDKVNWVFAGDGSKFSWLENEVKNRGLQDNVNILGRLPLNKMPALFQKNDIMLVSLASNEVINKTLPGKVQSYMISKKPIIGILDGEGKRVINESNCGIILDSKNIQKSIKTLTSFLSLDENEHIQMGINGYQYYLKNFEKDKIISKFESVLGK